MPTPKKDAEAEEAKKREKATTDLLRNCKNDEGKKAESAIAKGADILYENEKGNSLMHIAAGFGALSVIRVLHKAGVSLDKENQEKLTPLQMAQQINEENAAALIEALLAGKSGDDIGAGEGEGEEAGEAGSELAAAPAVGAAASPAPAGPAVAPCALAVEAAAKKLLDDVLSAGAGKSVLVRALSVPNSDTLRSVTLDAAAAMVAAARASGQAETLYEKLEALLDGLDAADPKVTPISTGLLTIAGQLAGNLEKPALLRLVALSHGTLEAAAEPATLLSASLASMASANTAAESRTAACGIGAACGALGEGALASHGVLAKLHASLDSKPSKAAAHARESALLAVGALCLTLRYKFEPYSIPMLPRLVKAFADKDMKAATAATLAARAALEGLSSLSVKSVLGALYEGMQVVGGGGRTKIECLSLASLLAIRAPRTMGPCLPECIPLVMECLNDSNGKVQAAAEAALPKLCSCVDNPEVASTLKEWLMLALRTPDKTLACIDEVLMTTFCNPMDGTSLAFMMPVLLRGIRDANYELVKKATVCTSNMCALIKDSSDIAPFVPALLPLLEQNLEHSSPDVRAATELAKSKLLEGAGDLVDPRARATALAATVRDGVAATRPGLPAEVLSYLGETSAAMLEEKLGGVVRVKYFRDAVPACADWLAENTSSLVPGEQADLTAVAAAAVEKFKEMLSEPAKEILAASGDKDFALDIQNIILAFAGRVLLRKADIRFERGHRYGLVGQNGTGKTTLLNRLAAKDINGFPKELRTWYIRHEVLCDDGIDTRAFLRMHAPAEAGPEKIESVLKEIGFPESAAASMVNSLSGGFKMKLSVALSILHEPELLLLDEPTNHLDRDSIDWLTAHLLSLKGVTLAVVSHDYDFIDDVCTDITHYDNNGELGKPCHFVYYPTNFKGFQQLKPEVAAGLPRVTHGVATAAGSEPGSEKGSAPPSKGPSRVASLAGDMDKLSMGDRNASSMSLVSDAGSEGADLSTMSKVDEMIAAGLILPMRFPDPGKPEGIRTYRKPIMTLKEISFKYPGAEKFLLEKVSCALTLGSRAVIVGGNGSGKTTFLQLLIGDLECEEGVGSAWKHHNLRFSYVAQQSLHHLEDYLTVSPIHYIQERFRQGLDAELGKLKTMAITEEEQAMMKEVGSVCSISGRQQRGRQLWYEVIKTGRGGTEQEPQYYPMSDIENMFKPYVKKLIANFDQRAQALESGMAIRPITAAEVLAHLSDFGIDSQLAHGKIRQMSGGQRQRLVICAAFWSKPHVIALDEPTNYLDNDSVAALTKALKDFKGAVVTVSENEAFVAEISNEKWVVENGSVTCVQLRDAKAR